MFNLHNIMLFRRITVLGFSQIRLLSNAVPVAAKIKLCEGSGESKSSCKGEGSCKGTDPPVKENGFLTRAEKSGPCRMVLIPEEWFVFLYSKTGVSGPYFLMIGIINYLVSKEIFVMEHEYYTGVSVFLILYFASTRLGSQVGVILDKEVDAVQESFEKDRNDEIAFYRNLIKESELAQERALGQQELMAAKKENIALQLEAIYRERAMMFYQAVRNRMDYHVKIYRARSRIEHKWMYQWIMEKVHESITPEFQKQAMESAIAELATISSRAK